MRTDACRLASALLALSCASAPPRRDLARVEDAARVPLPISAVASEPDERTDREVAELLARPLTADSAVRVALLNNRELRAALREVAVARGRAVDEAALPNPGFQFDFRRPSEDDQPLQKDFLLEYDLTRAALAPLRARAGEADVAAERLRAAGAAVDLGARVRAAFYAAQAARHRLAISNRTLDALAAGRDAARALSSAGNLPELELAVEEATYEGARASTAEVELEVLDRREELSRLLGLHGAAVAWTIGAELPAPEREQAGEDVEAAAVRSSLELAELNARLEALSRRTALARAEGWIPGVTVDGHVEQDDRSWEVGGGATIVLPLFDRGRGALAAHEAEFDALVERRHATAIAVRSAARGARDRLASASRRARHWLEVVVPARRRVVDHALRRFNAMDVDVFDLLRFQRELLDAELASAEALSEYWIARASIDALVAGGRAPAMAVPTSRARPAGSTGTGGH